MYCTITTRFKLPSIKCEKSICYYNKTRRSIAEAKCNAINGRKILVDFVYQGDVESYCVSAGTPVIASDNLKEYNVNNSDTFHIERINKNNVTLNNQVIPMDVFRKAFTPAYAVTVLRYQGGTIGERYNLIVDHGMNKKQLYTALSRSTKLEYIRLENSKLQRVYNTGQEQVSVG